MLTKINQSVNAICKQRKNENLEVKQVGSAHCICARKDTIHHDFSEHNLNHSKSLKSIEKIILRMKTKLSDLCENFAFLRSYLGKNN